MEQGLRNESIVAEGTKLRGNLTSECPVTVSGSVDGELIAPILVVTGSGSVSGKVKVRELNSTGEISGQIDADTLQLAGRIKDNTSICARSLEVRLSSGDSEKLQVVFGTATLEVGPDPAGTPPCRPTDAPG